MRAVFAAVSFLALIACNRDPQAAKKGLVERGDTYFRRRQYTQASVLYRLAVQKDKRYALAYYKLALADLLVNAAGGTMLANSGGNTVSLGLLDNSAGGQVT